MKKCCKKCAIGTFAAVALGGALAGIGLWLAYKTVDEGTLE